MENDYPRIIAVDDPLVKPLADMKDIRRFSQHSVDLLNLEENRIESTPFESMMEKNIPTRMDLLTVRDMEAIQALRDMGRPEKDQRILTFDPFLTATPFIGKMRAMLGRLEKTYRHPVDIEFTVNFNQADDIQINLLQCRPFQTISMDDNRPLPETVVDSRIIIKMDGRFMGGNISQPISKAVYVSLYADCAHACDDHSGRFYHDSRGGIFRRDEYGLSQRTDYSRDVSSSQDQSGLGHALD